MREGNGESYTMPDTMPPRVRSTHSMMAGNYECPVCGIKDSTAYMRCMRPDCTDGRDQDKRIGFEHRAYLKKLDKGDRRAAAVLIGLVIGIVLMEGVPRAVMALYNSTITKVQSIKAVR